VQGGYPFSVQNQVRYVSVLSLRTRWVASGGIPEVRPTHKDMNWWELIPLEPKKLIPERLY